MVSIPSLRAWRIRMCDYSLHSKASRPAKVGETLTTTQFTDVSTRGFTGKGDPNTAVCVLPGTEIAFADSVRTNSLPHSAIVNGEMKSIGVPPPASVRVATFTQVDKDHPHRHHDALEFANGDIVLLHNLEPGQKADVLTLPADPKNLEGKAREAAEAEQRRAEFV
jgi:hypothetical protein